MKVFSIPLHPLLLLTLTIVFVSKNNISSCFTEKEKAMDWGEPETSKERGSHKFGQRGKV
jgi:hypothetical protein